jgi:hypothetical protein
MREDTFTNTVEDAAAYEALRGRDADFGVDPREYAGERPDLTPKPFVCRARHHSRDGVRRPGCWCCPSCGSGVIQPVSFEAYYYCEKRCGWTSGVASEPPF